MNRPGWAITGDNDREERNRTGVAAAVDDDGGEEEVPDDVVASGGSVRTRIPRASGHADGGDDLARRIDAEPLALQVQPLA